jgi:soluble lytic murein transglycosylase-like protein
MNLKLAFSTALIGILTFAPAYAKDKVFKAGSSRQGGQVVNSYSNLGSVHVKKRAKVVNGAVTNVVPYLALNVVRPKRVVVAYSAPASGGSAGGAYAAPYSGGSTEVYTYAMSANQRLQQRYASAYTWSDATRSWSPAQVAIHELIQSEAQQYGIDPLIIECIIHQESNFDPQATSHCGAAGLMQLMPETAADLGVTNSYDPAQNVAAGTRYFVDQYRRFGSIELALAAYNAGPGNVEAYGGIPPFEETQQYVANIAGEYLSRRRKR